MPGPGLEDRYRREAFLSLVAAAMAPVTALKVNVERGGGSGEVVKDLEEVMLSLGHLYAQGIESGFNPDTARELGMHGLADELAAAMRAARGGGG